MTMEAIKCQDQKEKLLLLASIDALWSRWFFGLFYYQLQSTDIQWWK